MKRYLKCLSIILKHKYYVFLFCLKLKVPIHLALLHDWSKLTPKEWFVYSRNVFNKDGSKKLVRDSSGAYDPGQQTDDFKRTLLSHQKRNKHHWQAWVLIGEFGKLTPIEIPEVYIREMLADWLGASKSTKTNVSPKKYYESNKNKMLIHKKSRIILEELIKNFKKDMQGNEYENFV